MCWESLELGGRFAAGAAAVAAARLLGEIGARVGAAAAAAVGDTVVVDGDGVVVVVVVVGTP